jgi:hypothetical protein
LRKSVGLGPEQREAARDRLGRRLDGRASSPVTQFLPIKAAHGPGILGVFLGYDGDVVGPIPLASTKGFLDYRNHTSYWIAGKSSRTFLY